MKFRDYVNEAFDLTKSQMKTLNKVLKKNRMQRMGIRKPLGKKPRKGDFIQDFHGDLHEIDMVSGKSAYTVPPKGSSTREQYFLDYLVPDNTNNVWVES